MPPFVASDAPIPKLKKEYTSASQPSGSLGTSLCCKNDFITHDREIRQPQLWLMAAGESVYQLPTWLSSLKIMSLPRRLLLHCSTRLWQPLQRPGLVRAGGEETERPEKPCQQTTCKPLGTPPPRYIYSSPGKGISFVRRKEGLFCIAPDTKPIEPTMGK